MSTPTASGLLGSGTLASGSITGNVFVNSATYGSAQNVVVSEYGISIKDQGDIVIGDRSMKQFMKQVEDKLLILIPNPAKLEKYEALKKAYDHYKMIEKLLYED